MAINTLQRKVKTGANNFHWIAGLSVINTLIFIFGGGISFVVGLGITQLIDGFAYGAAEYSPANAVIFQGIGFVFNLFIAGVFILFGIFAGKGRMWAFIIGMVFYGLDALLVIAFQDYLGFIFHIIFLVFLFGGVKALVQLKKVLPQTTSDVAFPKDIGTN
jgi:hypothetical protein